MECQYCKHILKNEQLLKNHQATAKFCLKIRGEPIPAKAPKKQEVNYKAKYEELEVKYEELENKYNTLKIRNTCMMEHNESIWNHIADLQRSTIN